jgi:mitochondrial cardiolipin hydrolase
MQDHEVRETLRASLQDGQLDRAERDSFRHWLEASTPDDQRRGVYQSMAFDLVREALERNTVNLHSALNWLERIIKLLTPFAPGAAAGSIADACFSPQHDCAGRIVRLFESSRRSVDVCVFTITDDRIAEAILRAHRRGIPLRIITDNDKLFDPGSDVQRLERAGIPLRIDITEFHMHHKFAIFDGGLLLNGSYNWTRSAALNNEENFIVTSDAKLVEPFRALFNRLWDYFGNPTGAALPPV